MKRFCHKAGEPTTDLTAEQLVTRGYRRISNAYGRVARIDRPDWLELLAQRMRRAPADFIVRDGSGRVSSIWCSYYRSTMSKDVHTVDAERMAKIPTSGSSYCGYVDPAVPDGAEPEVLKPDS